MPLHDVIVRRALRVPATLSAQALVLMVSPFAPHLGEECWKMMGSKVAKGGGVAYAPWVEWNEELCVSDAVVVGVQVGATYKKFCCKNLRRGPALNRASHAICT